MPEVETKTLVKNYIDHDQLKRDVSFRITDLNTAMMEQASLLAHYGGLLARASRQVDNLELLIETKEAQVYRVLRDTADKTVKITEAQLDKAVAIHPEVLMLKKAFNEAKQIEVNARIAVESFRHRRDMLIQTGLITREEMKGELSIKGKLDREEAVESLKERTIQRLHKGD